MNDDHTKRSNTIEYLIDYKPLAVTVVSVQALKEKLAGFEPTYARLVPIASVFISPEREVSLLETLAQIPGIAYRRGVSRRALDREESHE